jgi:hypothetical protein
MLKLKQHTEVLLKLFVKKLDSLFCHYLGIHKEKMRPLSLCMKNNYLIVTSALPFKRHVFKEPWNEFNVSDLTKSHSNINEKLGLAAGKTIAKGLIISFEEVEIDSPKFE